MLSASGWKQEALSLGFISFSRCAERDTFDAQSFTHGGSLLLRPDQFMLQSLSHTAQVHGSVTDQFLTGIILRCRHFKVMCKRRFDSLLCKGDMLIRQLAKKLSLLLRQTPAILYESISS